VSWLSSFFLLILLTEVTSWLTNIGANFLVLDLLVFYCTKKYLPSFSVWLCFSCIIHNLVLSSFLYYSHVFLCRVSVSMAPLWHRKPAPARTAVLAVMLRNMIKWTLCISTFHIPWGCPTKILCVTLFFFFFVTSSTTLSLPDFFTETIENIFRLSHSVLSTLEVI
jgi:hypothetical protein